MPQIFKALVTVTIWGAFIAAWLGALLAFIVGGIIAGYAYGAAPPPMFYFASYAIAIGFAFAGGFLIIVRKKLEE